MFTQCVCLVKSSPGLPGASGLFRHLVCLVKMFTQCVCLVNVITWSVWCVWCISSPGLSGETVDNQEPTPALPATPQAQQLQMTNHFHLSKDNKTTM